MGRPQIRHIRTAVESWRKYSRISSPVPVIAELSLLFCGRRNRSSSGASRNRKNHDTLLFCRGRHGRARPIYSTSLEHHSRSSIKIKRGIATRVIQDPIGLYCSRQQWGWYADALSFVKPCVQIVPQT